jgi:hypothetical protein
VAPRVHDVPPPSRDLLPILLRYLNPAHGPTAGGIEVALVGANFQGGTVFFDTTIATLVSADDTVLVAIAPPGEGIVPVYVTDGPDTTDMLSFRYDVPSITSISPAGGPAGGGAQVTLSGDNFGLNPTVLFDATAASIVSHTHTQIVVQSPAGTPGSQASVTVVVAGQASNALSYAYVCADGTELQGGVCEPDSPSQWIQNLEDRVAALPAAAQRGLGSSLKQAVAILQDGNTRNDVAACGKLQAFVHQVDAMVKTHRLSASDAAALVDAATHAMLAAGCHV